jgi:hypothetical protein
MEAKNGVFGQRPIGGAHDPPQRLPRPDLAAPSSRRVGADAHEIGPAQRDARFVTGESASAAWRESIHSGQRQIHRQASIHATS